MRINFNSKDAVFAIKAENEEEKAQLKTSAAAIRNLIIDFFDGEIQEMKAAKNETHHTQGHKMSNRSYLVPRPPAFDHEHPRPKEEGEVLYCGNCSKWYVSWFPLTEVKTIWGRRPEWWIRIFHRKSYETIIQQIRRETK